MTVKTLPNKIFFLLVIFLLSTKLFAVSEVQIKAVFLEKFTHLVQWPDNNTSEFRICILNDEVFTQTLKKVYTNKTFNKKPVNIISLSKGDTIPPCNLLFIGKGTKNADRITAKFAKEPILTVSDDKSFVSNNIMITIFLNKKRFKYIINNKAAQDANVKISYLLLKSAQEVIR